MARRPRRLGAVVPQITLAAFGKRGFAEARVLTDWPRIVGPELAATSCPEKIGRDHSLTVRASSGFALELQHLEPQVLDRIATYFGYRAITRLVIRQGPLPAPEDARAEAPRPLTAGQEKALAAQVAITTDPDLRQALAGLGRARIAAARRRDEG
ncbi:MAG: DciA family protein [Alphaproteobacteria bacterium]|jgi:hypothetical protein|nr:DciA family protein [Alphaproteobacteria bacterium]